MEDYGPTKTHQLPMRSTYTVKEGLPCFPFRHRSNSDKRLHDDEQPRCPVHNPDHRDEVKIL